LTKTAAAAIITFIKSDDGNQYLGVPAHREALAGEKGCAAHKEYLPELRAEPKAVGLAACERYQRAGASAPMRPQPRGCGKQRWYRDFPPSAKFILAEGFFMSFAASKTGGSTMTLYDELVARGLIAQVTDEDEIRKLINNGKATFYIGFDPTADSLHVGHFMALCLMKRLQAAGNRPIALIGGGTAMVGDPSGRSDMRQMMTPETIQHNCDCFKKQMSRFIEFGEGKAQMVNNADWLLGLNYIDFLRDVGACFSVNKMLTAECYKQRMEKGLSFLEFNYMIMQSYDFLHLYENYGCNMEFGGDDQWSNMLGGTELIRRKLGKDAYAMTITLLLNSEGKKMGKTQSGAVWLDPNKTSPFEFYQYWRNVDDADVLKCIRMLTFLPMEQIDEMSGWQGEQLNRAKEILAYELTALVHGKEEAENAQAAARALFSGQADTEHMPSTRLSAADLQDGKIGVLTLMVKTGLAASNGEARRVVQQGGVLVDGEKLTDAAAVFTAEQLAKGIVLKKGKKVYHRVLL
jgi:tyrosyl-tRNA synthetase